MRKSRYRGKISNLPRVTIQANFDLSMLMEDGEKAELELDGIIYSAIVLVRVIIPRKVTRRAGRS